MKLIPQIESTPTAQWKTAGYLYDSIGNRGLGEDMFQAWLPDGTMIDAGWTSQSDPNGMYRVSVTREFTELRAPFLTPDIHRAAKRIEELAKELLAPPVITTTAAGSNAIFYSSSINIEYDFEIKSTSASNPQEPACV